MNVERQDVWQNYSVAPQTGEVVQVGDTTGGAEGRVDPPNATTGLAVTSTPSAELSADDQGTMLDDACSILAVLGM